MNRAPQRIVCLSAEAADWLWRIGAWEKVVGVTAFFMQPPDEPPKPRVSGFSSANIAQIEKLKPDLVITFSDVQAKLTAELMQRGLPVFATNQRTLAEIETTLALLGRIVNCEAEAERWLREFRERLAPVEKIEGRPRVYFEEWNDPLISGIAWVGELIERAGGKDIFPELRDKRSAPERIVSAEQIRRANPEIIFASWCGKPVRAESIVARPGWRKIEAVRQQRIHEIPGADILQAGFRLVYGYEQIRRHLQT
ncbi:MAG: helical backbone metal receptor [Verrucomicrobiae bacterium]|nr:helical backbone metal receptor [Verrucomicrobiae bacterium]